MDPILPFGSVEEGMMGKAYTVVDSSGEIRNFDVDIVGPIDDGKGGSRMIMARATGPVIEQTGGILQGMSGSPVYVDGNLVGAVAAGIKDMTPYTFFITPIEDMMTLWQMPDTKDKTRLPSLSLKHYQKEREDARKAAEKAAEKGIGETDKPQAEEPAKAEGAAKESAQTEAPAKAGETAKGRESETETETETGTGTGTGTAEAPAKAKEPVKAKEPAKAEGSAKAEEPAKAGDKPQKGEAKSVLYLAGFGRAGMDFLQKRLPMAEIRCVPMGTPSAVLQSQAIYNANLQPGSPVGVAVAYGDFAVGATGTVTAVDGKRVLAFGHPFLHRGNVSYFMTDANVVGTISGVSNGMKVASVGHIIGRINQDRETGVAGILGEFPSVVPVRVHVADKTLGASESYGTRIAYDEDLLSKLVGSVAYAAMNKTSNTLGSATAKLHFAIRTNAVKSGMFERSNMYYSTADVGQIAVGELIQAMDIISANTEKESDIVDVKVDVEMDGDRKTASLVSAAPDKLSVKPGETVNLTTTIKPYRKEKETIVIPYKVPETQKPGAMHLDLRGGAFSPAAPQLLLLSPTDAESLAEETSNRSTQERLAALSESSPNNVITVMPSVQRKDLTARQKRAALRAAEANAQAHAKKISLLGSGKKKEKPGETKFETNYIIDNVIHATLQIEKK
nr:SpoIVB peptidase S55 domain-containing protein [uncultured Mitsuokella sp.]